MNNQAVQRSLAWRCQACGLFKPMLTEPAEIPSSCPGCQRPSVAALSPLWQLQQGAAPLAAHVSLERRRVPRS